MYTTCEAGKRRSVNHTRARSLASPSRAGPGRAVAVAETRRDEARRGAVRPAGRAVRCACACAAGRDVQVQVPVRCGAVRRDVLR